MRPWERWVHIQDMLDMYHKDDMRKWLCQHAVVEITRLSLMHMVVSFPSDEERRSQLMRDGIIVCGIVGFE